MSTHFKKIELDKSLYQLKALQRNTGQLAKVNIIYEENLKDTKTPFLVKPFLKFF